MLREIIGAIDAQQRKRRFAMKVQQKLDRALDAFVLRNATDWHPEMSEAERAKECKKAEAIIKRVRKGEPANEIEEMLAADVEMTDRARAFADERRAVCEKEMARLVRDLPIYPWWSGIHGAGDIGLATIIGLVGDLSNYPKKGHVWKRLGFAPYEGLAGSTWKRKSWRPRALTNEEWAENPFNGERYAMLKQIAVWLRNAQCESKEKSGTPYGRPTGPYGECYVRRREHTAKTHPEWSDGHAHDDALRVMMKRLLRDLWQEWRGQVVGAERPGAGCPATEHAVAA